MKNFSSSIQRRKRGTRTEYIARLTYYDKTGKRKGVARVPPLTGRSQPLWSGEQLVDLSFQCQGALTINTSQAHRATCLCLASSTFARYRN